MLQPDSCRQSSATSLAKGAQGMNSDSHLSGREERRLPIMMEVTLVPVGRRNVDRGERTFTDNISAHGIRVKSANVWRMGEQAEVTPMKGEVSIRGEIVYCQKAGDARFFVGLKFPRGHVPWSILKRFNGLAFTGILAAMRW